MSSKLIVTQVMDHQELLSQELHSRMDLHHKVMDRHRVLPNKDPHNKDTGSWLLLSRDMGNSHLLHLPILSKEHLAILNREILSLSTDNKDHLSLVMGSSHCRSQAMGNRDRHNPAIANRLRLSQTMANMGQPKRDMDSRDMCSQVPLSQGMGSRAHPRWVMFSSRVLHNLATYNKDLLSRHMGHLHNKVTVNIPIMMHMVMVSHKLIISLQLMDTCSQHPIRQRMKLLQIRVHRVVRRQEPQKRHPKVEAYIVGPVFYLMVAAGFGVDN